MYIGVLSNLLKENYINNNKTLGTSLEKLSTGLRINKASDNASGIAISDKLRTQASGIKQGIDNANSAIAMMNIADKSMSELSSILDTIKVKAIQMNTDTTSNEGRKIIKTDILKLIESYDDIVCGTSYNQTPLLNGCATPFDFQVGDNSNEIISINVGSVESRHMGEADPYKLKNFITGFNAMPVTPTTLPEETGLVGQSGVVRVNFSWNDNLDIDPVIIDPNGDAMGYHASIYDVGGDGQSNTTSTGGNWDIDDTGNGKGVDNPNQENFFWATSAPIGNYQFYIKDYNNNHTTPADIKVTIKTGNSVEVRNYTIPLGTQEIGPFIFNYDGSSNNSTTQTPSCNCGDDNLVRNDDSPTLLIQAQNLMKVIDEALNQLNTQRANIGAGTNQLESSSKNHMTNYVNIKNAESIIRDVDYSEESSNFNKANIIAQAGSYVQSQANEIDKQSISQLLK